MTTKPKPNDPAQSQRFIDMAREVQADEDPAVFDRAFARISQTPAPSLPVTTRSKTSTKDGKLR